MVVNSIVWERGRRCEMERDQRVRNDNSWCFACGEENPIGLKLKMSIQGECCTAYFTPQKEHQSYDGNMHGGLISTLLDEVMGNYVYQVEHRKAYTAKIEIRFRQPVPIGETIKVEGKVVSRHGRLRMMEGKIWKKDGTVAAEATASMMLET